MPFQLNVPTEQPYLPQSLAEPAPTIRAGNRPGMDPPDDGPETFGRR